MTETTTQTKDISKTLDELIPRDVISKRDGGRGRTLDYLETWYVIDRMNQVFGHLNWSSETLDMVQVLGGNYPCYRARVRVYVRLEGGAVVFKDGYGWGSDKSNLNPHELAVKEAESDAFKRAAMKFGRSMGLALYDKTQEYVEDATTKPLQRTEAGVEAIGGTAAKRVTPKTGSAPKPNRTASKPPTPQTEEETTRETIYNLMAVVEAKKLATMDAIKTEILTKYGVASSGDLNLTQLKEVVGELKTRLNLNS